MALVQWNIRGYRANYHSLRTLIYDANPYCLCLQEVKLSDDNIYSPRNFTAHLKRRQDGAPHGGVAILVRKELPSTNLHLNTNLQAVAIRLQLDKLYTICSLYLPPNDPVTRQQIENLISQLPEPFLLLGDYNARHPLWGDNVTNAKGTIVESILDTTSNSLLNDGKPTHLHMQTDSRF